MKYYRGWLGAGRPIAALVVLGLFSTINTFSYENYPIYSKNPPATRQTVITAAESYLGVRYVYGGEERSGMDCSGLVFASYLDATGYRIPRTVKELVFWVVPISGNKLQPGDLVFFSSSTNAGDAIDEPISSIDLKEAGAKADHVGIYAGGGLFVHSASVGLKTGVIYSSLSDKYWYRRYLFAGRAVSPQAFSGLYADFTLGAAIDPHTGSVAWLPFDFRGIDAGAGLFLPIGPRAHPLFELGLQTQISYDTLLGVARIPIELSFSTNSGFSVFFGPAITLGSPTLPIGATVSGATAIPFVPISAWVAAAGIRWSPMLFHKGPGGSGPYFELRYNRYAPGPNQAADQQDTMRASLSFGLGFRFRDFF